MLGLIHAFVHASAIHVIRWMHHFVSGLSMFSCSCWIHAGFEASHLSFIVFLLCLIPDYHCELLSSICYCTNDEMNVFKQHLNWWQKLQLLQWLSPLISHHFSNQNQKRLLAFTFFPSLKVIKQALSTTPKLLKQASSSKWKEEKKSTIGGNKWERTSFYILK